MLPDPILCKSVDHGYPILNETLSNSVESERSHDAQQRAVHVGSPATYHSKTVEIFVVFDTDAP